MRDWGRAGLDDWREFWSQEWKDRRAMGILARRDEVERRLAEPVELPHWLSELLMECREEFTPRQVEALVYRHGYGLSLQEAADALGVKRQTFRKRLAGAQQKVEHLTGAHAEQVTRLRDEHLEPQKVVDVIGRRWHRMVEFRMLAERQRHWERTVDRLWGLRIAG